MNQITLLRQESVDLKHSKEELSDLIKNNTQKSLELEKLGHRINTVMTDNKAIDTLVKRYNTIKALRLETEEAAAEAKTLPAKSEAIQKQLNILSAKEKEIYAEYLKQLPKVKVNKEITKK